PIPREEARARLGLPLDKRLVLFVGNPAVERKRYPLACEAVDILKRSLPADLMVAWSGRHREVPVWMNACDVLVFTSMQEGSPNAVKEALACDLPVVSVPVGDVAQRIGGVAGCELCPDDKPESIAAALERVLRRGIRAAGRAAVQDLDERRLAQQVIDVYRSVLGARNGGPAVVAERRPPPVAAARGAPSRRVSRSPVWAITTSPTIPSSRAFSAPVPCPSSTRWRDSPAISTRSRAPRARRGSSPISTSPPPLSICRPPSTTAASAP